MEAYKCTECGLEYEQDWLDAIDELLSWSPAHGFSIDETMDCPQCSTACETPQNLVEKVIANLRD